MKKRAHEPTELEKTYMVRHIWLCEKQGMDERKLSDERKWLADKFDCRVQKVAAITAHMRIRVKDIVPGQLTLQNAQYAHRWVSLAGSVRERDKLQTEVAEYLQVSRSMIQEITEGVRNEVENMIENDVSEDGARAKEPMSTALWAQLPDHHVKFIRAYVRLAKEQKKTLSSVYEELAQYYRIRHAAIRALVEEPEKEPPQAPASEQTANGKNGVFDFDPVQLQKTGEFVDYDTKSKEAWRATWKRFIEHHTDPAERAKMRVLCLPGRQCLEIPLYLELGFRPENIVAVEGGHRIAKADMELTAKRKAAEWGGMPDVRLAWLQDILLREKEPFDIVSLDFIGQMCSGYLKIASQVPVRDRALFLITHTVQRWTLDMQKTRQNALDSIQAYEREELELARMHHDKFSGNEPAKQRGKPQDIPMAALNLGADREEHWVFRQRLRRMNLLPEARALPTTHQREKEEQNIAIVLEPLLNKLVALVQEKQLADIRSLRELRNVCNLGKLVMHVMFDKPVLKALERWSYQSTVSKKLSAFHTDLAVVCRARGRQEEWKSVVDFLSHCVEHVLEFVARGEELEEVLARIRFELRDDQFICLLDSHPIGQRNVKEVLTVAQRFGGWLEEHPCNDPSMMSRIPRKEIHY